MIDSEMLKDEARAEVKAMLDKWPRPHAEWPRGTVIAPCKVPWLTVGRTHRVTFPQGGSIVVLTQAQDEGKAWADGQAPRLIWWAMVDPATRAVCAIPHVCNSEAVPADEDRASPAWLLRTVGLHQRFIIGQLSRPLRERTYIVSDGWGYE